MKRIDTINVREDLFGPGKAGFSDNADLLGQDATYLSPDWLNTVQEELANLLELNEILLNPLDHTQLFNLLATKAQVNELKNDIDVLLYSPIPYASIIPPTGFLMMMGQAISVKTHPKLYALYGPYLPDMRAKFIRGVDNGRGIDTGRMILTEQGDAIRNITGTFSGYTSSNTALRTSGAFTCDYATLIGPAQVDNSNEGGNTTTFDASRVVPTASENRPSNIAFNYIIKAG